MKRLSVLCFFALVLSAAAEPLKVCINEVQSSNDQTFKDAHGESPDWVELYNGEATNVDLTGWALTDKPEKPSKWWKFPAGTTIGAGEHLVVLADSTEQAADDTPSTPLEPNDESLKANLVAWYRADDVTGNDNTSVSSWTDQSDCGNDATQETSTARPTLKKNAVAGHAALQFASTSSQCLKLPFGAASGLADMADVTVIVVGKLTSLPSSTGYSGLFDVSHPSTSANTSEAYQYNTYLEVYGSGGKLQTQSGYYAKKATSVSGTVAANTWYAFGFTTRTAEEDTSTTLYLNGGIAAECEPNSLDKTALTDKSVAYLGNTRRILKSDGSQSSAGSFFNGQIAEVIVFNRALAADEYARVNRYLAMKYGLPGGGADELHASFSVSGDGETLALFDPASVKADEVTFGKIPCDRSYGRKPDGGDWTWFAEPTPGGANDTASYAAPMLEPVVFDHTRGLYNAPFTLTLSHPSNDVKIVYTTDHSEPTESSPEYTGPISISKTTIVRAAAFRTGCVPCRNVTTHTYLFINTVVDQTPAGTLKWYPTDTWKDTASMPAFINDATGKWEYRTGGQCSASYTVSKNVIKTDADKTAFVNALMATPIVSVTLDDEHLFGNTSQYGGTAEDMGILSQPNAAKGVTYQADAEWLTGEHVFATPVGFTAHGMYARRFEGTPKVSLRLKFRGRFNASTLDVPVFSDVGFGRDEFKSLVLRGEVNNGWHATPGSSNSDPAKATSMMDQFVRDVQQEMQGYSARGTYVHLFLNGLYWGLYNMTEQASDDFASQTWSGDLDHPDDYNIVVGRYDSIRAGTATEYKALKKLAEGGIDTPESYAAVASNLDLTAYADYMLLECFIWNDDWPGNNYAAISSGKNGVPCRFIAWDAERACLDQSNKDGKTKSWPENPTATGAADLHVALKGSKEYKLLLADRAQKFLFNGGALTAEALTERYQKLAARVRPMLFADAARWGAYRYDCGKDTTIYGLNTWDTEKNRILDWLSERGDKFLAEMKNLGYYPNVTAASVSTNEDRQVTLTVPSGATVWYTTDGSDPREMFATATPSSAAQSTTATKTLDAPAEGMTVKARVLSNGTWSALTEVSVDGEVETRNVFIGPTKDENWSVATNWSYGTYPNAAGATAVITDAGGFSGKGKRSIYVTEDVTVGELVFRNGDKENDIEQGEDAAGDLTFAGAVVTDGETGDVSTNNASITVADKASTGHAEIGLGKAHVVHLGTDLTVTVDNTVGSAEDGGLRLKGVWDGGGHDLKKLGAGRLTISFTNAADTVFGKLQAEEGVIAIEKPIHVTEITKKGGTIYLPVLGTDGEPAPFVVVDGDINDKLTFGLFVPSVPENEGEEIWCTGGIRAGTLPTNVKVYVPDASGNVFFNDQRWSVHPSPSISVEATADGNIFKVSCPKIPAKPAADVVINEVQSSNDLTLLDDREESPDWVELWNREATNVDLSGWVLTDKAEKPEKWWRFPQGSTIKAGEHLVVYADSTGLEDAVAVNPLAPNADSLKGALVAWYDADKITTLGTTWADQSGNGFDATKSGSPTLVANAVNGHKAVSFSSSSSQSFTLAGSGVKSKLANLADVTVIVVGKWSGTKSNGYAGLFGVTHGANSGNTCLQLNGSDGKLRLQYSSSSYLGSSAVMASGTWAAAAFTTQKAGLESAQSKVYFNGECVAEGTANQASYSTAFGANTKMYLGAAPFYGTSYISYFDGQIAEVIIYNRALSSEECLAVYKSLNEKYNLAGDAQAYHHTSFSISASGETLTLFDPASVKADEVTFGKIPCDTSYGRVGDGETWAWFADPTPKSANGSVVYDAPLEPVVFSRERGVFTGNETVTVELTHPDPEAKIYYTTDRSEPTASSTPYAGPITIKETTNLRATAILDGHLPYRNVTTHSYIWLDRVEGQKKPNSTYPDTWTDTGSTIASYGPSMTILSNDQAKADFVKALTNAPIVSVTLSDEALFGSADGLYIHPNSMEEREPVQADVEWVTGDEVFGMGVGLDMHGAYSRRFDTTPKKSFKLKFSGAFGGSLDHNVLASGGGTAVEYKKLVLRGENNHSWTSMEKDTVSTPGGGHPELGQSMVDQFFRNTQKLASGFQAEGTHVHLFLNGLYWGLYNLTDHVCDAFAASTFCTDVDPADRMDLRKNFDVIKNDTSTGYAIRDGSDADYKWIKSNIGSTFANAGNFAEMTNRFDISSYIDYLLIEWYIANEDWPGNNWVMAGSSKLGIPMRFVLWDSDKSVRDNSINLVTKSDSSGAMAFHNSMKGATGNAEYKLMFADRIQKLLFDEGGALTTESVTSRYRALSEKVETYVFAESARWGAYIWDNWDSGLGQKPQTSKFPSAFDMTWWYKERDRLTGTWFPQRRTTLISQLKNAGLWSDAIGKVSAITTNADHTATLDVPTDAAVYYTTDGSDPREMFSGKAAGTAYENGTKIELPEDGGVLKVRALANGVWSALTEVSFPELEKRNELIATGKDTVWNDDASWSLGYYPNEPGAIAILGVPDKVSKKFNRKVAISNETGVTVGHVEISNDTEKYNVIANLENEDESMSGGDLTFCGEITDDGATTNDASLAVIDTTGEGYAKISLEAPNAVVRLASKLNVTVSNTVGDVNYGGLLIKGAIAGNGHDLAKWGPGRMTLACTNAADDVLGNLQCNEGILAVEAPLHITSVTKETGTIWLKLGGTDIAEAFESALVCDEKLNKTKVGLFVPTTIGSDEEFFYGGAFCAEKLSPGEVTIYVQNPTGDVVFCDERWLAHPEATYKATGELTVESVKYLTFEVKIPYFGPPREPKPIVVDAAGGLGAQALTNVTYNEEFKAPACSLWDLKRAFKGWKAVSGEVAGEKIYQPGEVIDGLYKMDNPRLVAVWEDLPNYPTDEPEIEGNVRLAVGESTNIVFRSRLNLRHWLIGSTNGFSSVTAKLSIDAVPTTDYAAYQLRTTNVANEVTLTLTGAAKGSEDIFFARQYKLQEPEYAAKFRVFIGD